MVAIDKKNSKQTFKERIVKWLGGKCALCNWDDYIEGFDVHHINPELKDYNLSNPPSRKWNDELIMELENCVLLCCRCHRGVHANKLYLEGRYFKAFKDSFALENQDF